MRFSQPSDLGDDDFPQPDPEPEQPKIKDMQVATINVTALTKARLKLILENIGDDVGVVCLQEIRASEIRPRWILRTANEYGWATACSHPPPFCGGTHRKPTIRQGGCAILWRRSVGRVTILRDQKLRDRMVGLRTSDCTIISMYGHQWFDRQWMTEALDSVKQTSSLGHPTYVCGDLNLKNAYNSLLTLGWKIDQAPDGAPPVTTAASTSPTRALFWGSPNATGPVFMRSQLLPGIPHHCLVWYKSSIHFIALPRYRLRHTAGYALARDGTDEELYALQDELDEECGPPHDGRIDMDLEEDMTETLLERWGYWHQRAEAALLCAVNKGVVELQRPSERPKGSTPSQRPVANAPQHRPEQSVAHRRLPRLHQQLFRLLETGPLSRDRADEDPFQEVCASGFRRHLDSEGDGLPCLR